MFDVFAASGRGGALKIFISALLGVSKIASGRGTVFWRVSLRESPPPTSPLPTYVLGPNFGLKSFLHLLPFFEKICNRILAPSSRLSGQKNQGSGRVGPKTLWFGLDFGSG